MSRLTGALRWAREGWPVLPCYPDGERVKSPLVAGGKDSATTDEAQITAWWRQWPDALVGGRTDGLVVLDFDAYKPGHDDDLTELGDLPPTRTFRTPGRDGVRGRHLVYLDPDGECRSTKLGLHGTIDVRAGTSRDYVILPTPGGPYEVADARPPAVAPAWLLEAAGRSPVAVQGQSEGLPDYEDLPPGTDVSALASTGVDGGNEHTARLTRNGLAARLSLGQLRTLLEDDEVTTARRAERKRQQPRWWPEEFDRCVRWAQNNPRHPGVAPASYEAPAYPMLPDEFWERPELAHIRQAAQSRLVCPDATLAACLARVSALVHWRHQLPAIIGGRTSLDLLVAVIAGPGFGKGGAMAVAAELVPGCDKANGFRVKTAPVGSTEGMGGAYFDMIDDPDDDTDSDRPKQTEGRYYNGVLFSCDEGSSYKALSERSGQTTSETIRAMFKGEAVGHSYTGKSKRYTLPAMRYRASFVMAFQPVHARSLLSEWEAGTPTRFLWTSARDPEMPEVPPEWDGRPVAWRPPAGDIELDPIHDQLPMLVKVASSIKSEIRARHRAKHLGEWDPGRYDGHRDLLRLKVAALFGCLREGWPIASRDDWRLAGLFMDTSDAVRARMLADINRKETETETTRHGQAARRADAVRTAELEAEDRKAEADHERVRMVLLNAHKKHPELPRRDLLKRAGRDYHAGKVALNELIAEGLVSWPGAAQ